MKILYRLLWIILVLSMVWMTAFGARGGEWRKVKINAEILCTSCVGLSK